MVLSDSFFRSVVASMQFAFDCEDYHLAALYCNLAQSYLLLFDDVMSSNEMVGDENEKND